MKTNHQHTREKRKNKSLHINTLAPTITKSNNEIASRNAFLCGDLRGQLPDMPQMLQLGGGQGPRVPVRLPAGGGVPREGPALRQGGVRLARARFHALTSGPLHRQGVQRGVSRQVVPLGRRDLGHLLPRRSLQLIGLF